MLSSSQCSVGWRPSVRTFPSALPADGRVELTAFTALPAGERGKHVSLPPPPRCLQVSVVYAHSVELTAVKREIKDGMYPIGVYVAAQVRSSFCVPHPTGAVITSVVITSHRQS